MLNSAHNSWGVVIISDDFRVLVCEQKGGEMEMIPISIDNNEDVVYYYDDRYWNR
jgi:hypothetical protein